MIVSALKIIDYAWMEKCLGRKDKWVTATKLAFNQTCWFGSYFGLVPRTHSILIVVFTSSCLDRNIWLHWALGTSQTEDKKNPSLFMQVSPNIIFWSFYFSKIVCSPLPDKLLVKKTYFRGFIKSSPRSLRNNCKCRFWPWKLCMSMMISSSRYTQTRK